MQQVDKIMDSSQMSSLLCGCEHSSSNVDEAAQASIKNRGIVFMVEHNVC